jgi:hypothetical protein
MDAWHPKHVQDSDMIKWLWKWKCVKLVTLLWWKYLCLYLSEWLPCPGLKVVRVIQWLHCRGGDSIERERWYSIALLQWKPFYNNFWNILNLWALSAGEGHTHSTQCLENQKLSRCQPHATVGSSLEPYRRTQGHSYFIRLTGAYVDVINCFRQKFLQSAIQSYWLLYIECAVCCAVQFRHLLLLLMKGSLTCMQGASEGVMNV